MASKTSSFERGSLSSSSPNEQIFSSEESTVFFSFSSSLSSKTSSFESSSLSSSSPNENIRCAEQLDTIGKLKRDKGLAEELLLKSQSNSMSYVNSFRRLINK
jgi:hypothetical protein